MAYPSIISALATPQASDRLNSPSHSQLHQNENAGIIETQTFLGTLSSTQGTISYDVRSPDSNGGGHVQTANKGGTGQTIYTKGDLLVASSSSVLTKLAVGGDTLVLTADSSQATGVKWGSPAAVTSQSFLSSGVWTRPSGISATSKVLVELWGAGGSGGAASVAFAAGGGGGGSYINMFFQASTLASSVLVSIGAGGAGVVANNDGNTGGRTVFGNTNSILTAFGGGAGAGRPVGNGTMVGGIGAGTFMDGFTDTSGSSRSATDIGVASALGGYGGFPVGSAKTAGGNGLTFGSASGGGGGGAGASVYATGGNSPMGGAGGGGVTSSFMGIGGSAFGIASNGGNGSIVGAGTGASVQTASGSGGVYGTGATSGRGGNGMAVITTFL